MTRRKFLSMSFFTLSLCVLPFLHSISPVRAQVGEEFMVGVNYPWIAYGHDFGGNAWGHDGLITNGWTYQTYTDSQGFTDTRVCSDFFLSYKISKLSLECSG